MTILTHIVGLDVVAALACRRDTIVTAGAVAGDRDMIESCGCPGVGGVASLAIIAALNMGGILACCNNTVVAV